MNKKSLITMTLAATNVATGCTPETSPVEIPVEISLVTKYEIDCIEINKGNTPLSLDYCSQGQKTVKIESIYEYDIISFQDALNCVYRGIANFTFINDVAKAPHPATLFIGGIANLYTVGLNVPYSDGNSAIYITEFFSNPLSSASRCQVYLTMVHEVGHTIQWIRAHNANIPLEEFVIQYGLDSDGHDESTDFIMSTWGNRSCYNDHSFESAQLIAEGVQELGEAQVSSKIKHLTSVSSECKKEIAKVESLGSN